MPDVRLGSIASISAYPHDVRFTPDSDRIADMSRCRLCATSRLMHCSKKLFDHLVGDGEHSWRNCNSERLGRFDIQNQFKVR